MTSVENGQTSQPFLPPTESKRVTYVNSQRGKKKAVYQGHLYYRVRERIKDDAVCWNCEELYTKLKCKARVRLLLICEIYLNKRIVTIKLKVVFLFVSLPI